jgi:hypothetical protein
MKVVKKKRRDSIGELWLEVDRLWERVREIEDRVWLDAETRITDAYGETVDPDDYKYPHFPYSEKNGS